MLIDLHTHTHPLSYDSSLDPDALVEAAKRTGLDGICLTEHDFFWDTERAEELGRQHNLLVIPGIEVNTEWGHIIVFGLDHFIYGMHRLDDLSQMVADAGGVMIAAHPYRRQLPFELSREGDWSGSLETAVRNPAYGQVSAIETCNGRGTERQNAFSAAVCDSLGLPRTAGSDAHQAADVGTCATDFERPVAGAKDLIVELRAGRFRPAVLRGAETADA